MKLCQTSDSLDMLIQDAIVVWVLSVLGGGALIFSLVFTTGWWSNCVKAFIRKSGDDINWSHLNSLNMYDEQWKVYGVSEFKAEANIFAKHRHVRKALKETMAEYNIESSLKEFSLFVLHIRGGSVRFNDYVYDVWRPNRNVARLVLSLNEVARLKQAGFDSETVLELVSNGLSFEQVLESKGMPAEWAVRMFSGVTV